MRKKRTLALVLAAAVAMGTIPAYAEPETADPQGSAASRVMVLDFKDNLKDSVKTERLTAMKKWVNDERQEAVLNQDYSYVEGINPGEKALKFQGGSYLSLGEEADLNPSSLTFACWINPGSGMSGEQILVWNKNEWNQDGWYLSSFDDRPLVLSIGTRVFEARLGQDAAGPRSELFPTDTWTHLAVTFDNADKQAKFYINGEEKLAVPGIQEDQILNSSVEKSMGYNGPVYKGSYLNAAIDRVVLMDAAATEAEILALYQEKQVKELTNEEKAWQDANAISVPATTYGDITLPVSGTKNGSTITWTSSHPAVIAVDGTVQVPESGSVQVTMTAEVTCGEGTEAKTVKKEFTVTVKKMQMYLYNHMMDDITLSDEYLENAQEKDIAYLLSMNSKQFLYEFYKVAGLKPPTDKGYGGWERSDEANFRGHFVGHYFSALSQAYLSSHDAAQKVALLEQIQDAVDGLKECQDAYSTAHPKSAGYISAFRESALDAVEGTGITDDNVIVPWYNLHKVLAGVMDIAKNTEDQPEIQQKAMAIARNFGDYIYNRTQTWSESTKLRMLNTEYGGMNEALYELFYLTGEAKYKEAAHCFDETAMFEKLAAGEDVLAGKHANTTIPKLIGAVKRYLVLSNDDPNYADSVTAEEKADLGMYLDAAVNFWDIVVDGHTYITGGNSQSEHFHEAGTLAEYADNRNCETCNTYNMLKLSRYLFQVTKDKKYMDYYENTYINAILSSQNPDTGMMMYFQPMKPGYFKVYNSKYNDFWCCTGTGVENFTKLGDTIYLDMDNDVYVNMYFSSTYNRGGLSMTVSADLPADDQVSVNITGNTQGKTVRFRIPDWAAGEVTVTGASYTEESGYMVFRGLTAGTTLTFTFPMEVKVYDLPDNPDMIAFKYGPVALSCGLGDSNMDKEEGAGILVRAPQADKSINTIVLVDTDSVEEWKENLAENMERIGNSADGQVQFRLNHTDRSDLVYTPHYRQYTQRYGLYMVFASKDSEVLQLQLLEQKKKRREAEAAADSIMVFDNNNSEKSHNLQGDGGMGSANGRTYRDTWSWFSYDLAIADPSVYPEQYLNLTYAAVDVNRTFDVYINDELFVHETIVNKGVDIDSDGFYIVRRQIPEKYLKAGKTGTVQEQQGKPVITVKIQATKGPAGGLYGISVSTDYDNEPVLESLSFGGNSGSYRLTPSFDPDITEYTLKVPAGTKELVLNASPKKESGLVYSGDILYDDAQPRTFLLNEQSQPTVITLNTKAQDHQTARMYVIIVEQEE